MNARIKICGLTREVDLEVCLKHRVEMVGFNCWATSPRYLSAQRLASLLDRVPSSVEAVLVFVRQPADEIGRLLKALGDPAVTLQLHGGERLSDYASLGKPLLPVVAMQSDGMPAGAIPEGPLPRLLLDRQSAVVGGSGQTFDWTRIQRQPWPVRDVILAGGLTPDNVQEALRSCRPWGVDVASGVERSPGIKDPAAIARFVAAVRSFELGGTRVD